MTTYLRPLYEGCVPRTFPERSPEACFAKYSTEIWREATKKLVPAPDGVSSAYSQHSGVMGWKRLERAESRQRVQHRGNGLRATTCASSSWATLRCVAASRSSLTARGPGAGLRLCSSFSLSTRA